MTRRLRIERWLTRETYLITVSSGETAVFRQKAFSLHGAVMKTIGNIMIDKRFKNADALSLTVEKIRCADR